MKRTACGIALTFAACIAPATTASASDLSCNQAATAATSTSTYPENYAELSKLFADWRQFALPVTRDYKPDYSAAAMAAKQAELPKYQARLKAIDTSGWPKGALIDYKLVQAEMSGSDFDFRVLMPWARDPTFYRTVFAQRSDVPGHEGPHVEPAINLYEFTYPLSVADDERLAAMLAAIPSNLAAAKLNLRDSNAKGLWEFGDRALREQSETLASLASGTLVMRTLDGSIAANMQGASSRLRAAIRKAKAATDQFAAWVAVEAPKKSGPTGVGKDNYNWYAKNVQLIPYDWDAQVLLMQRELDRSLSALRLEELRNRNVPPIREITDPAAYNKMAQAKAAHLFDFMVKAGFVDDKPELRAALLAHAVAWTPPEQRNFFARVSALDPLLLQSHSTHWIDLARMKYEPNASPIRREPSLFNIFDTRSEGFATAMEELLMRAGLYDPVPHGRELVWIAAANRAARGLASLYVQSNEWDLARAGRFQAEWTPRHLSDSKSKLVGFEQLLYARQPGYGPSYIVGKMQLDHLIARVSFDDDQAGCPFMMGDLMKRIWNVGVVPVALIEAELTGEPVHSPSRKLAQSRASHRCCGNSLQ